MSPKIPDGWSEGTFNEFITLQRGFDLPVQNRLPGDVPVYASNGVIGSHCEARIPGPSVVTGRSGTLGKVFYYRDGCWPLNTTLYVKDFHGNDPGFVYRFLEHFDLERFGTGTGVPTLNRNIVHGETVVFPPVPEQRRVADILSSVDEAIQVTQAVIEQTRKVKQGVLKRLLTKGIAHTEFKQTEIGEMPGEWEIAPVRDCLTSSTYGLNVPLSSAPEGVGVLRMGNIQDSALSLSELKYAELDEPTREKYAVRKGDILFNRTNSRELVGKVAIAHDNLDVSFASYIIRLRVDTARCDPWYLHTVLSSYRYQDHLRSIAAPGASQANINAKKLGDVLIPLPNIEEQGKIVEVIYAAISAECENISNLNHLHSLKSALMSDLLTGRKRVFTDLAMAAE